MRNMMYLLGGCLCAGLVFADSVQPPFSMIRFLSDQTEDAQVWKETLAMLKANRAVCDEVWFSTGIGVASLERHRKQSANMARAAADLRAVGIVPSVQFQATMGHSDAIARRADCSGKTWGGFTGRDGVESKYCSCPRQPGFKDYLVKMGEIYAAWQPGSIWVDDDLRLDNHSPVMKPLCWCDTCVNAFAEREGVRRTRAELAAACDRDPALYDRYERFGFEALADCAAALAETVRRLSPETRMGYQHGPWRNDSQRLIYRALAKASGRKVGCRPGGGAYLDHDPRKQVEKVFVMARQMAHVVPGGDIDQVCPEVETCPRSYACRTGEGLTMESFLSLAQGMDSLSYFIMDPYFETPAWYGETLFKSLGRAMPQLRAYVAANAGTLPGGFVGDATAEFARIGLPLTPGLAHPVDAAILSGQGVRTRTDAELRQLVGRSLLLDGAAAEELTRRGFGAALLGLSAKPTKSSAREFFTDDPVNAGLARGQHMTYVSKYEILGARESGARLVGEYVTWDGRREGVATALAERDGRRVAILGCGGFVTEDYCSNRFRQIQRLADALTGETLPARIDGPCRLIVSPRTTREGFVRSVGFCNASIGRHEPVDLLVRRPQGVRATWHGLDGTTVELEVRREKGASRIRLPELAPWTCAYVTFLLSPTPRE